ncbi:TPA: SDR family oxidoreductase [Candidatus Woesearchaeota archaeon]|nr:SDR family oxidoreductase [Candidatus Woesearchaeota archaeon]
MGGDTVASSRKWALISGGASGLGLRIAGHLLSGGWSVAVFSNDAPSVESARQELLSLAAGGPVGDRVLALVCDISSEEDVVSLVRTLKNEGITPDAVINAAAILGPVGPFHENDFAVWARTIDIDLVGNARLLHAMLPLLLESVPARIERGESLPKIVNFGGGGAGYARLYHTAYGTAKTAMVRLTESIALEYKGKVECNIIAPGAHKTAIWNDETHDKEPAQWSSMEKLYALIDYLTGKDSDGISGRFIHIENDYRSFTPEISGTDRYQLRRTN